MINDQQKSDEMQRSSVYRSDEMQGDQFKR